jgi:hypothetical protein
MIFMKNGFKKMEADYIEDTYKREVYELKII